MGSIVRRGATAASTAAVLVLLLGVALATSTLITRATGTSRDDAARVLHMETIRRIAAEQRSLEREAVLSKAVSDRVLDRFMDLSAQMDAAFAELDAQGESPPGERTIASLAAAYEHVLSQQLQLIHDGYLSSAEEFGATRVSDLGAALAETLSQQQALLALRAEQGARRAETAVLVTLLLAGGLLALAALVIVRTHGAQLATREALGRHASDLVAVLDPGGRILRVESAKGALLGKDADVLVGSQLDALLHPEARVEVDEALALAAAGRTASVRARMDDGKGGWRHLDLTLSDGREEVGGLVMNGHDVTELTELEARLRYAALHDGLTGLPNRSALEQEADRVLSDYGPPAVALLLIDLDDFKHVNDTLGHASGDIVLLAVAERLRRLAPQGATPARLGGDEFALLLPGVSTAAAACIGRDIVGELSREVTLPATGVAVGCSVGVAGVTPASRDLGSLLQHADAAMYAAKRAGKNRVRTFAPRMLVAAARRLHVLADLRDAVVRDELVLHYQPLTSLASGGVVEVEALVRWQHPERGLLPPSEFVPVAEESGLILPIGRWVLATACAAAVRWNDPAAQPVRIAVNVSPRELLEPAFRDEVAAILADTGLAPHLLTLEVTEQILTGDPQEMRERLCGLAALGVRLAVDDFGTGASSLQHLRLFPFHSVKIARAFIDALADGSDGMAFLAAIIHLAHTIGLETVAEGVADAEQLATVRALGCTLAQGFHIADAVPLEALEASFGLRGTARHAHPALLHPILRG